MLASGAQRFHDNPVSLGLRRAPRPLVAMRYFKNTCIYDYSDVQHLGLQANSQTAKTPAAGSNQQFAGCCWLLWAVAAAGSGAGANACATAATFVVAAMASARLL